MKYSSDIYEIPLSVFIEIYTNEGNDVEFKDGDKDHVSERVINDYMEIVSGRQLLAEILNCNERMNLAMTVELMKACENMMRLKMYDDECTT